MALEAINRLPQHSNFAKKFGPEGCFNIASGPNQSDRARIKMTDAPISGNAPHVQEIISRAEAKARGLVHYYTGKPCLRGHYAKRQTTNGYCRGCYEILDKEIQSQRSLEYRQKNAEKIRASQKQYHAENKEKVAKRRAEIYASRADEMRARNRRNYIKNPELFKAGARNRKARVKNAVGRHSQNDIEVIKRLQKNKCAYCRASLASGRHIDHIIPLARGGTNWPNNIQLLCPPCNMSKKARDPIDFAQSKGLLV